MELRQKGAGNMVKHICVVQSNTNTKEMFYFLKDTRPYKLERNGTSTTMRANLRRTEITF